eukprot:1011134-Rhodomonas_salina.3
MAAAVLPRFATGVSLREIEHQETTEPAQFVQDLRFLVSDFGAGGWNFVSLQAAGAKIPDPGTYPVRRIGASRHSCCSSYSHMPASRYLVVVRGVSQKLWQYHTVPRLWYRDCCRTRSEHVQLRVGLDGREKERRGAGLTPPPRAGGKGGPRPRRGEEGRAEEERDKGSEAAGPGLGLAGPRATARGPNQYQRLGVVILVVVSLRAQMISSCSNLEAGVGRGSGGESEETPRALGRRVRGQGSREHGHECRGTGTPALRPGVADSAWRTVNLPEDTASLTRTPEIHRWQQNFWYK